MDKAGASGDGVVKGVPAVSQAVCPWAQDTAHGAGAGHGRDPSRRGTSGGSQAPGGGPQARMEVRLGADEASLTHKLKHQVNVPVILRPDHIQEPNDVWMVPKFLGREPAAVFWGGGPGSLLLGRLRPGRGQMPRPRTWSSVISRNVLWNEAETHVCAKPAGPKGSSPTPTGPWGPILRAGPRRGAGPRPALPSPLATLDYLGICLVPEGIEDFLDGHDLASPPVHRLPHDPIGLGRREVSRRSPPNPLLLLWLLGGVGVQWG